MSLALSDGKKHTRSCNTGCAIYNVGGGVDTLHLTYYGQTSHDRLASVISAKEYVGDDLQSKIVESGGTSYNVSPTGMGRFAYALKSPYFVVKLSKPSSNGFPCAQVQIKSEGLFKYGLDRCLQFANDTVLYYTNGHVESVSLSRLDLYNDMATDYDFASLSRRSFVSQSRQHAVYFDGVRFSGVTSGAGGNVSFRMYDKLLESKKAGKSYWLDHYKHIQHKIFRCEFQLKSQSLRALNIDIHNFKEKLSSIWRYLTTSWFRIVEPQLTDSNTYRWSITSFWSAVQKIAMEAPIIKRFRKMRLPSTVSAQIRRVVSGIASFSADGQYKDFSHVLTDFIQMSSVYFQGEESSSLFEYYNKKRRNFAALSANKVGFVPVPHDSLSMYDALRAYEVQYDIPF